MSVAGHEPVKLDEIRHHAGLFSVPKSMDWSVMQRWKTQLAVLLVTTLSAIFGVSLVASPAQAVGCYGDYCSGTDPQATGCSADGQVVASANVYGQATLQLRWSPTCKTNWARLYIYPSNQWFPSGTLVARQSSGYTQTRGIPSTQGERTHWTPQIYSPQLCVRAEYHSSAGNVYTGCI